MDTLAYLLEMVVFEAKQHVVLKGTPVPGDGHFE